MQRHCRVVRVKPEAAERYIALHRDVWPQVERRLLRSNITNFSIFRRGDVLVSYFEYVGSDFDADMRAIAADAPSQQWGKLTAVCLRPFEPEGTELWSDADELWHLDSGGL